MAAYWAIRSKKHRNASLRQADWGYMTEDGHHGFQGRAREANFTSHQGSFHVSQTHTSSYAYDDGQPKNRRCAFDVSFDAQWPVDFEFGGDRVPGSFWAGGSDFSRGTSHPATRDFLKASSSLRNPPPQYSGQTRKIPSQHSGGHSKYRPMQHSEDHREEFKPSTKGFRKGTVHIVAPAEAPSSVAKERSRSPARLSAEYRSVYAGETYGPDRLPPWHESFAQPQAVGHISEDDAPSDEDRFVVEYDVMSEHSEDSRAPSIAPSVARGRRRERDEWYR